MIQKSLQEQGKGKKADRNVKTIAGRLVRELESNLSPNSKHLPDIVLFKNVLAQKRTDKNKSYSLHESSTCCNNKGKENQKYEFGNKMSFVKTTTVIILGVLGFRNEYDGHTLEPVLKQVEKLVGKAPKIATVGRGYRGKSQVYQTQILIPSPPKKNTSRYQKK